MKYPTITPEQERGGCCDGDLFPVHSYTLLGDLRPTYLTGLSYLVYSLDMDFHRNPHPATR